MNFWIIVFIIVLLALANTSKRCQRSKSKQSWPIAKKNGASIAKTHIIIQKHPIDERIAALHREATQHKKINWPKAVTCLQEAADLMRRHRNVHTLASWLRLPVFLQHAGRFTEAEKEFERLLKETPARIKRESRPDASANWIEYRTHLELQHIYDKMRLVYKRENRESEATQYAAMSEEHGEQASQLWMIIETEREQKRAAGKS